MIIKNYDELGVTRMRQDMLAIIEAGFEFISPENLMTATVKYNKEFNSVIVQNKSFDLFRGRIFVIGGGKAGGFMAQTFEKIVGPENITAGAINCVEGDYHTQKIEITVAGHPLPDKRGVDGVEKMMALKEKYDIGEKDLVVCLISGGASSLLTSPVSSFDLKAMQDTTEMLINSGADINEINIVRKHLSRIKGGRLAEYFSPAKVLSIIISDVPGNSLNTIASGLTVADPSTFADALNVLTKYNLVEKLPPDIKNYIVKGSEGKEDESPKSLTNAFNYIIGDSAAALEAMALKAKSLGFKPIIVTTNLIGDPIDAAANLADEIINGNFEGYDMLLLAGEITPKIPEIHGKGGRNMHFAALNLLALSDYEKEWVMASFNSDGRDYIEDAAGALVGRHTFLMAKEAGIDIVKYIKEFDTYNLFKKIGNSLIKTGPTGTNVGDIMMYYIK